tara:strand:- start:4959 stop:6068 length:1110 start_codon:yes stop_codon:yes gene_type:complete
MKITFTKNEDQLELIKAMASRDNAVAHKAQLALARFVSDALGVALDNARVVSNLFEKMTFNSDDNPSIPLDVYYDITDQDYITVWHQSQAGGLAYNQTNPTDHELKLHTYSIETAAAFDRRHAARSRVDVITKTFQKIAQEILMWQEISSANLLLGALAEATTSGRKHVQRANASGEFKLHDFNQLVTLADVIDTSWIGGTPVNEVGNVTDLMVSPLMAEKLRAMAYNPISTSTTELPGTEKFRDGIFAAGGGMSFYGIEVLKFKEFGKGKRFNTIFDTAAGATAFTTAEGADSGVFVGADEEILVGIDRGREGLVRAVAVDSEFGNTNGIELGPDNQFVGRQKKIGFYGDMEEGRVVLDDRALFGVIV